MATRRPFWKWHRWKSIGFCLWPPSTCIWNLKLKFQSKLDLCSGNHVVYRQTDGRTDGQTDRRTRWIQYTPPPTSLGGGIMNYLFKMANTMAAGDMTTQGARVSAGTDLALLKDFALSTRRLDTLWLSWHTLVCKIAYWSDNYFHLKATWILIRSGLWAQRPFVKCEMWPGATDCVCSTHAVYVQVRTPRPARRPQPGHWGPRASGSREWRIHPHPCPSNPWAAGSPWSPCQVPKRPGESWGTVLDQVQLTVKSLI